jgi:hypothetical protein
MLVMIKTTPPLPRLGVVAVLGVGNTASRREAVRQFRLHLLAAVRRGLLRARPIGH